MLPRVPPIKVGGGRRTEFVQQNTIISTGLHSAAIVVQLSRNCSIIVCNASTRSDRSYSSWGHVLHMCCTFDVIASAPKRVKIRVTVTTLRDHKGRTAMGLGLSKSLPLRL